MKKLFKQREYNIKKTYGSNIPLYIILAISLSTTIFLVLIGFLSILNVLNFEQIGFNGYDFFVIAVLSSIGPIGFYNYIQTKKKKDIEFQLPDFLREISSSTASGMTVYDAIGNAAKADHGKLTSELQRISAQLSWGISVKQALNNFAQRVGTDLVKRMTITVNKALEIGGNTSTVFEAAAKEIDQVKKVENQRKMEMSLYSIVIFLSFFVFLTVLLIIDKTIFAAIFDLQTQLQGQSIGQVKISSIDHEMLKYTFFSFIVVQSMGGGLLGGFMMDGRLSSGVRFGFILVLISFFVFKIMF